MAGKRGRAGERRERERGMERVKEGRIEREKGKGSQEGEIDK